jgi:hypothetical protein
VGSFLPASRTSWGFNGGGLGSGLWKTTDAGKTWAKIQGSGFPDGLLGRIGIDVSRSNPNVIYAQIEVGASTGNRRRRTNARRRRCKSNTNAIGFCHSRGFANSRSEEAWRLALRRQGQNLARDRELFQRKQLHRE